jgi:hypothetical protein
MATPEDVAKWMLDGITAKTYLRQPDAVEEIRQKFGEEFAGDTDTRGVSISPEVLKEFRKLSTTTVVWERYERTWRKREPRDPPGRRQVD